MEAMNRAAHGLDVDPTQAREAIDVGYRFLAELREHPRKNLPDNDRGSA
jgi:hypothetical protein